MEEVQQQQQKRSWRSEAKTAYEEWQVEEGIPRYSGSYIENLNTLELGNWARKGVKGGFVNLAGQELDDAYVVEIPPKGQTKPEHHMFEEMVYVLSGRGTTTVTQADGVRHIFEWGRGSLFAIPLNSIHQDFNSDGSNPARLVAVTDAPLVHNLFHNTDFLLNDSFQFKDRLNVDPERYNGGGKFLAPKRWETNFVPDVLKFKLFDQSERGAGTSVSFELAENTMAAHISEFPVGTYKKAHAHGPGAHIIILSGKGYSLMWKKGDKEKGRYDWHVGTMISPSDRWYHQHFNTGSEPVRYLALRFGGNKHPMGSGFIMEYGENGDQIEYEDEDPEVRRMFEEEVRKNGAVSKMGAVPSRKLNS